MKIANLKKKTEVTRDLKFEIEFIRLVNPMTHQQLGVVGIDRAGEVYVTAKMHPCALVNNDLGHEAYKRCYKAGRKVASFEGGFNVEAKWLLEELEDPFEFTEQGKTLTNDMLRRVVTGLMNATERWVNRRGGVRGASLGGVNSEQPAPTPEDVVLVHMGQDGSATVVESANEPDAAPTIQAPVAVVEGQEPVAHG